MYSPSPGRASSLPRRPFSAQSCSSSHGSPHSRGHGGPTSHYMKNTRNSTLRSAVVTPPAANPSSSSPVSGSPAIRDRRQWMNNNNGSPTPYPLSPAAAHSGNGHYTPTYDVAQWYGTTNGLLSDADEQKRGSSVVRTVARSESRTAGRSMVDHVTRVDDMLQQRVHTTRSLLKKLQSAERNVNAEITRLESVKSRAMDALRRSRDPLHLAEVRMNHRNRKPDLERIADDVGRALDSESVDLSTYVEGTTTRVAQIDAHLDMLKMCSAALAADAADKTRAVQLDEACMSTASTSADTAGGNSPHVAASHQHQLAQSPNSIRDFLKSSRVPVHAWESGTNAAVRESVNLVSQSTHLRKQVEMYLSQLQTAKQSNAARTKKALEEKVVQTQKLSSKLHTQIKNIEMELVKLEGERDTVVARLEQSNGPLRQCQSRLGIRQHRPTREMVRDGVEVALQQQLTNLTNTVNALEARLAAIDRQEKSLIDARARLEADATNKTMSFQVDRECLDCSSSDFASVVQRRRDAASAMRHHDADSTLSVTSSVMSTQNRATRLLARARSALR
eukprot:PhM_4_TR1771/c0_g1_i4/m.94211